MKEFEKYESMKASGHTPEEVFRSAVNDGMDPIAQIRMLRVIFGLSPAHTKEVMLRADGISPSLDEHQEKIASEILKNKRDS